MEKLLNRVIILVEYLRLLAKNMELYFCVETIQPSQLTYNKL